MKFRTKFLDYGHRFAIAGYMHGRAGGLRYRLKKRDCWPTHWQMVRLKMELKESFPWKRVKPMQFGKYAVRVPGKIKR